MSQASLLVQVLKQALRRHGFNYARVGKALGLSESSVKRMFARETLSLERIEAICGLMSLEVLDLLELAHAAADTRITELDEAQEAELAREPKFLLAGMLAMSHWDFDTIRGVYRYTPAELTGFLARLDRMGVIRLMPGNRVRVLLARNFAWRRNGPIQRFFEQHVQGEFFGASFVGPDELRLIVHGSISPHSNEVLRGRMHRLAEEFDALVEADRHLGQAEREGTTMLLAIRPWELAQFTALRRQAADATPSGGRHSRGA